MSLALVERLTREPNPVWMRELKQAARLSRTPVILAVVTSTIALLMASVGGIASVNTEPAKVGVGLFHTYFSLAYAVVAWIAPAVAAGTIASERGGRTWEALLLTGIGAPTIARGKFLAALTYIGLYVIMLSPVGALSFLFGGITAVEVLIAFVALFLIGALGVAFGLAVSSSFASPAVAVVVTLLVAVPLSGLLYMLGGVALSFGVHHVWPAVPEGFPIWLPTAYVQADFGLAYVGLLIFAPLVLLGLPAWFLYEITVANLRTPSDDRSTGLRRWFLVSTPIMAVLGAVPAVIWPNEAFPWALGISVTLGFLILVALVFAGEPLSPSQRVERQWEAQRAKPLRRFLGPGLLRAMTLLLLLGTLALAMQTAVGCYVSERWAVAAHYPALQVGSFGAYALGFFLFIVGFTTWTRTRSRGGTAPRLLLVGMLFVAMVGPWMGLAIAGVIGSNGPSTVVLASPSPSFAVAVMAAIADNSSEHSLMLMAGLLCTAGWALLGVGLLGAGILRSRRLVRQARAAAAQLRGAPTGAAP